MAIYAYVYQIDERLDNWKIGKHILQLAWLKGGVR